MKDIIAVVRQVPDNMEPNHDSVTLQCIIEAGPNSVLERHVEVDITFEEIEKLYHKMIESKYPNSGKY